MSKAAFLLVATALALVAALASPARVRAGETQVAFDHAGKFFTLDARLAHRLGVFADTTAGFSEARLFAADDSSYVLEITSQRSGRVLRERSPMSAAQVESLRNHIDALVRVRGGTTLLDRDGRLPFVLGSAGLGLAYYGWAVPAAFDVGDASAVGMYLVTAGASFFLPWYATSSADISSGQSRLALYGATRGIWHGILLADLSEEDVEWRTGLGWSLGTSVGEGVLGYVLGRNASMDEATAATIGVGGDFGMVIGAGAAAMGDAWDDGSGASASALMLGGAVGGMVLGRAAAASHRYSVGDASVVRAAATLGGWAGLTVTAATKDDAKEATWGSALVLGTVVGLGVGDRLASGRGIARNTGMMVEFGSVAGWLMGMGIPALANGDDDASGESIMWGGLIGGSVGYLATYSAARRMTPPRTRGAWDVRVEPTTLAGRDDGGRVRPVPALALSARF